MATLIALPASIEVDTFTNAESSTPKRRLAPADKIAAGIGTRLAVCWGWSSYARYNGFHQQARHNRVGKS
jgi:hypothetical protein